MGIQFNFNLAQKKNMLHSFVFNCMEWLLFLIPCIVYHLQCLNSESEILTHLCQPTEKSQIPIAQI